MLSAAEREELVRRVRRRVSHPAVNAAIIGSAVDRVVGTLVARGAADDERVVLVSAESMPDLASRLRAALGAVDVRELGMATEGRHTVVAARIDRRHEDSVRAAAARIGARLVVRDRA